MPMAPGVGSGSQYPLDLGRIFELTFSLFRFNWRTFVVAALLVMVPVSALLAVAGYFTSAATMDWYIQLQEPRAGPDDQLCRAPTRWWCFCLGLLIGAIAAIGSFVAEAAVTRAAVGTYNGERPSAVDSVRFAAGRLLVLGGGLPGDVPGIAGHRDHRCPGRLAADQLPRPAAVQITGGPGVFVAIVIFVAAFAALIFLTVRWALVIPVIVIEGLGAVAALRGPGGWCRDRAGESSATCWYSACCSGWWLP